VLKGDGLTQLPCPAPESDPAALPRLQLPAEPLQETGVVQLNEPADADRGALLARLRDNAYDKPFVIDDGQVRRLYLGLAFVQSEMRIDRPHELTFAYTRAMMGFLLFVPRPRHVLIVGLGGGSLTRYCHRALPRARITTVEVDPEVIAFGDLFELPAQDARHALIEADAVDYFATTADRPDVVLLDGCDRRGLAPALCNGAFLRDVCARLRPGGLLVINLVGDATALRAALDVVDEVFAGHLIVQPVAEGGTRIAYAFNDSAYVPDWDALQRRARELERRHPLELPALARRLQRSGMGPRGR
jgi:spermidine synthase